MKFILYFIAFLLTFISSASATTTAGKKLPACNNSLNCVSSQAKIADKQHYLAPFEIKDNPEKAWEEFKNAIIKQHRMVITHETQNTLHAEATSLVFRFVDDINAILDTNSQLIHIRSASRVGHTDFGVNRKRIEALRAQLQKAGVIE